MDANTFATARNVQLQQLAIRFPNASFELAQAQRVENMIKENSPLTLLAAIILLLPTASEAAQTAACSCESAQHELLELAREAAALNRQEASRLPAQNFATAPPVHSLSPGSPASIVGTPEHNQGAAGSGHALPVSLNPAVQMVWDNGGSSKSRLTYALVEEDGEESRDENLGFATQARAPVTQSLDNLAPANKYKQAFAKECQLGQHTAKMFSCYVSALTPNDFTFKSLPDVKTEDFKKTLDALPEPWVEDKRFSIHGYATHKHAVNPTGLDEEELAAHKIPPEAQKLSDSLAKEQGIVRARQVKVLLPAAELAKVLHTSTDPLDNPKCLANLLRQRCAQEEEAEVMDTRSELEQFEAVVHEQFAGLNELLRILSDRLTLASHLSFLQDYDLQMQRAAAVAPQNKHIVARAFGREQQRSFSPHSSLPAERMKMPKTPKLVDARNILDAIQAQPKGKYSGGKKSASAFFGLHSKKGKSSGKQPTGEGAAPQTPTPGSKTAATAGASAASGNLTWKAKNQKGGKDKNRGGHPAAEE